MNGILALWHATIRELSCAVFLLRKLISSFRFAREKTSHALPFPAKKKKDVPKRKRALGFPLIVSSTRSDMYMQQYVQ